MTTLQALLVTVLAIVVVLLLKRAATMICDEIRDRKEYESED